MESEPFQDPDPANETSIASLSIDLPGNKRRRADNSNDTSQNSVNFVFFNVDFHNSSSNMETDIDPTAVPTPPNIRMSSSSATAAASEPSVTSTLVFNAIKMSIENYTCDTVVRFGRARLELYNRQVALRSLLHHSTNNTLPKDLCFNVQTGNPYKKSVPNRDALVAQEQAILHEAKLKILQQRIEAAKAEEQRLRDECQSFQDVVHFMKVFVDAFPEKQLLVHVNKDDCIALYRFHLAEKSKNMDAYCKRKEDAYLKVLERKQKTTPLTETVNDQQFKEQLNDVIYQNILAFSKKFQQKHSDKAFQTPSVNARSSNNEKPASTKKQKNHSREPLPKKSAPKPVPKPNVAPVPKQQHTQHRKYQSQSQSQFQSQPQFQYQSQHQPRRSYASVLASSNRDNRSTRPASRIVYQEAADDGWIKVPLKKRVPKNVSAKDPRDVPKHWRR